MSEGRFASTGFRQEIQDGGVDKIPDFDPRTGDHYWILPVVYRINDPARWYDPSQPVESRLLDLENLVMVTAVGCYYCEKVYDARLASRRCKGEPR